MKDFLKRVLPVSMRRRLRGAGRLRWVTKYKLLKAYGCDPRAHPAVAARFVFLDPEVESHSFEVANEAELAVFLAKFLRVDLSRVQEAIAEARADPVLCRNRGLKLTIKRKPPLGRRLSWFVIVRLTRPKLVVETGIHDGLGSEVILRALQLNAGDGQAGRLISYDIFPDTGWAVAPELRRDWRRIIGSTFEVLEPTLIGQGEVDLFVRDTPPQAEHIQFEHEMVARYAAPVLTCIDSAGDGAEALRDRCVKSGGTFEVFSDLPLRHVVRENRQAYASYSPSRRS